jgi:hypothetical protein
MSIDGGLFAIEKRTSHWKARFLTGPYAAAGRFI